MIRWPGTILVATAPVSLHLSFDRLAGIVREQLGADPRSDTLIVFHNRARTHVKLLWHDGSGYCLFYKRLDRGTYRIPLAIPPGARQVLPVRGVPVTPHTIKNVQDSLRASEGSV